MDTRKFEIQNSGNVIFFIRNIHVVNSCWQIAQKVRYSTYNCDIAMSCQKSEKKPEETTLF